MQEIRHKILTARFFEDNQSINQLAFISYVVVYRPFQELTSYSCPVQVSSDFLSDHLLSVQFFL